MRDLIHEPLERMADGEGLPRCEFVFTVPVLDGGDAQSRYKDALRQAATDAGWEQHGRISFVPEPLAALLAFLKPEVNPGGGAIGDGDRVLVFDSGAGTTDVVIATVRRENGRVFLDENLDTYSYRVKPTGQQTLRDFGGNLVTTLLARWFLDEAEHIGARQGAGAFETVAQFEAVSDREKAWSLSWRHLEPNLFRRIDTVKTAFSKNRQHEREEIGGVTIDREGYDEAMAGFVRHVFDPQSTETNIESLIVESERVGMPIKWILAVGGNSALPALQTRLTHLAQRHNARYVPAPEELIRRAVAMGALCTRDSISPKMPFDLEIVGTDDQGEEQIRHTIRAFDPGPEWSDRDSCTLAHGGELTLTVFDRDQGTLHRRRKIHFCNPGDSLWTLELRFTIAGGRLRITHNDPDDQEPLEVDLS